MRNERMKRLSAGFLAVATATTTIAVLAATAPAGAAVPPVVERSAEQVTADALPTVQIDGVVWDQEVVGDTVYVVGDFDNARPAGNAPGQGEVPRSNMLAYDLATGELRTEFVANLNSQGKTVVASPDGSRIYVGGEFSKVNGFNHYRIAALDPVTGAPMRSFAPYVNYTVNDLAVTNDVVYAGGAFNYAGANSASRPKLAAFSASDGSLLDWAPRTDGRVQTLALTSDGSKLVVGGSFSTLNGTSARGMGALDPVSGSTLSWPANQQVWTSTDSGGILDLRVDGDAVYGGGFTYGRYTGNLEGIFKVDATSGELEWVEDCHGDTYQVFPGNGLAYKATHSHQCTNIGGFPQGEHWGENMRHALAYTQEANGTVRRDQWAYWNLEGTPAPSMAHWFPDWQVGTFTGKSQAAWAVDGNEDYVVYGGEFLRVNNDPQQGLVRFARRGIAPSKQGPRFGSTDYPIEVASLADGEVRITFPANFDRDDARLDYRILRDGTEVHSTSVASTYWDRPTISFTDTGLTPGRTHAYRVLVTDADGNAATSTTASVTVSGDGTPSPYAEAVLADDARIYWRLGDRSGSSTAADEAPSPDATAIAMAFGRPGAIVGDDDTAAATTGSSSRVAQQGYRNFDGSVGRHAVIDDLSVEAWFRTTSRQGGRLVGFGNNRTTSSSSGSHDRMLYVSNDGRVNFGVSTRPPGDDDPDWSQLRTAVSSRSGFNDGEWHHVVGTLSSDGMALYVDGERVGTRSDVHSGVGYYGYWTVGVDTISSSWPNRPSSTRLVGDIDEVAVYHRALAPEQVANHYYLAGHGAPPPNQAPTAAFVVTGDELEHRFDASGSTDRDGTIETYAWAFGDGSTGTGVTAEHTYAAAGTYTVTLTVTDDDGATSTTSRTVTATEPAGSAPVAAFDASVAGMAVSLDASASTDSDGSIVSYAWDLGDGNTASGVTAQHTYATAGTYTVALTVTDDDGDTGTTTRTVTATASEPGPTVTVAADDFERTTSNGFGAADTGGTWTTTGSSANYSVDGGVARHRLNPGIWTESFLNEVAATDVLASVDVAVDSAPTGGGVYSFVAVRRTAEGSYRLRVRFTPTSTILNLFRGETSIGAVKLDGVVYQPGDVFRVQLQAEGTGTTQLAAKAWNLAQPEPTDWQLTATDTTAALQGAGGIGLTNYLSGSSTNIPQHVIYDNLRVTAPGND